MKVQNIPHLHAILPGAESWAMDNGKNKCFGKAVGVHLLI